jgi:hypothetical protein
VRRFSTTVDREDIEWAIALAERSVEAAIGGVDKYMREYLEFPKFCARVLPKIGQNSGWRSLRELKRDFRNNMKTPFELDNALKQLEAEGRIVKEERKGERGPEAFGYALVSDALSGVEVALGG